MFSIVKNWKIFFAITISFLIIGVGSILFRGFNLGIDFTGGSIMDLSFNKAVTVAEVRDVLKEHKLGNAIIQLENVDGEQTSKGVLIRTGVIDDSHGEHGYHQRTNYDPFTVKWFLLAQKIASLFLFSNAEIASFLLFSFIESFCSIRVISES